MMLALFFGAIIKTNQAEAATAVFTDNFDDSVTDTAKWKIGVLTRSSSDYDAQVVAAEKNGYLSITPAKSLSGANYNGYLTTQAADLTGGSATVKVAQKAGNGYAETIFSIGVDQSNFFRYRGRGSTLYLETMVGGKLSSTSIKSTTAPRYWRFRHNPASDTIIFETGTDGVSWELRRTVSRTISISNIYTELSTGTVASTSTVSPALFDDFRLETNGGTTPPPTTPTPTSSPTATPTATPTASPSPSQTPFPPSSGNSRGYLTTPGELRQAKAKADQGIEPYKSAVSSLLSNAGSATSWSYGTVDPNNRDLLGDAAANLYAKSMAYHVTGNEAYASFVRSKILEITSTNTCSNEYSGGNGCILTLSRHISAYIAAADLIEDYSGWSAADKAKFQGWLRDKVYRFTDWSSDERSTNWGSVGTATTLYIADYFANSGLNLVDRDGRTITPHDAYVEARTRALDRNNGNSYMYNSVCSDTTGLGIQYYGGIPEETGRDTTGCWGKYLLTNDSSWSYMIAHLSGTLVSAELLLRRGDPSLFDNIKSDGSGSTLRAILYVIDNPYAPSAEYSFDWLDSRKSILEIAYRYYRHPSIAKQLGIGTSSRHIAKGENSAMPHFGTITHGFATNENPGPPPIVPAP